MILINDILDIFGLFKMASVLTMNNANNMTFTGGSGGNGGGWGAYPVNSSFNTITVNNSSTLGVTTITQYESLNVYTKNEVDEIVSNIEGVEEHIPQV